MYTRYIYILSRPKFIFITFSIVITLTYLLYDQPLIHICTSTTPHHTYILIHSDDDDPHSLTHMHVLHPVCGAGNREAYISYIYQLSNVHLLYNLTVCAV